MNDLWGISDELFVVLYVAGLVAAVGFAVLRRLLARRPPAPQPTGQLGVAELAFLAAGPRRVAEAAVASLVDSGTVSAYRDGMLRTAATSGADPVETAVLREIDRTPRSAASVIANVTAGSAVSSIGDRLVEQRLLLSPAAATKVRRRAIVGLYLLLAADLLRIAGSMGGDSLGSLSLLFFVTAVLAVVLGRRELPARTVHGDRVLAAVRHDGPHRPSSWTHPAMPTTGAGRTVALDGPGARPDLAVRYALAANATSTPTSVG